MMSSQVAPLGGVAPAQAPPPAAVAVGGAQAPPAGPSKLELLIRRKEMAPVIADQLIRVLPACEVVLLCDDSDSMNNTIAEEDTDPFAFKQSTRWMELKKFCAALIEIVTAVHPTGMDIHFLNRAPIRGVSSVQGLQGVFSQLPAGPTPLTQVLARIFAEKAHATQNVLVIVVTDGEPTSTIAGDPRGELFNLLCGKPPHIHVSVAECTDQEEDMEYLDQWDGQIPNFDNTDDYREELQRVKNAQGMQFKFDYTDYCIKVILSTFVRWFFSLDQSRVTSAQFLGGQQQAGYPQQQAGYPQQQAGYPQQQAGYPQPLYGQPQQANYPRR